MIEIVARVQFGDGNEEVVVVALVVIWVELPQRNPAEDFLVAFRGGNRGPIIGEPSAGSTGQTAVLSLAGGWQLRVTVTR